MDSSGVQSAKLAAVATQPPIPPGKVPADGNNRLGRAYLVAVVLSIAVATVRSARCTSGKRFSE